LILIFHRQIVKKEYFFIKQNTKTFTLVYAKQLLLIQNRKKNHGEHENFHKNSRLNFSERQLQIQYIFRINK